MVSSSAQICHVQPTDKDAGREQIRAGVELPNSSYFSNWQRVFFAASSRFILHLCIKVNKGPIYFAVERKPKDFLWYLMLIVKKKEPSWKVSQGQIDLKYYPMVWILDIFQYLES